MSTTTDPAVAAALGVAERVQHVLDSFIDRQADVLTRIDADLMPLVEAARAATGEGKRLRPALCYWTFRACGGGSEPPVLQVAGSLELLHAAALVHDDIIDAAPLRRGVLSAHRRFASLARGWPGCAGGAGGPDFGTAAAILLGDLLLMWADELMSDADLESGTGKAARQEYDAMRSEVVAGAYLELVRQAQRDTNLDRAMTVLRHKSAKYTVERPVLIGAALADAAPGLRRVLREFGLAVGEAFQLRDDLLDVFGNGDRLGKQIGGDLREGKSTPLLALAHQAGGASVGREIARLRSRSSLSRRDLARWRQILIESGAVDNCETMITDRLSSALSTVRSASFPDPQACTMLQTLATACAHRTS